MSVLKTIKEMIKQRNGKIVKETDILIIVAKEDKEIMCIFKIPFAKFDVERLKEVTSVLNSQDIKHGLAIYIQSATSPAKKCVREIEQETGRKIEIFIEKELKYNITKHRTFN